MPDPEDDMDAPRADASGEIRLPAALAEGELPARAEVAIVGAGVMGLSIAYHLARRDITDVVVIERGYLAEGASGRNGGGVRQQWSTELNIRLMQESVELCRRFAVDLGVNVWFRQGGYLFLARSAKDVAPHAGCAHRARSTTARTSARESDGASPSGSSVAGSWQGMRVGAASVLVSTIMVVSEGSLRAPGDGARAAHS